MKKHAPKQFLLLLLAMLLVNGTVACNTSEPETASGPEVSTPNVSGEESPETEQIPETEAKPNLPEKDYAGYSFRIIGNQDQLLSYMLAPEQNGTVLNDAIYDANMQVMEDFNIKYVPIKVGYQDIAVIEQSVKSGQDDYDLAYMHNCSVANSALSGYYLNINDFEYVDTNAEWWPRFTVDSMTVNGKIYFYSNYSSYRPSAESQVCFFNKALITDNHLENPYELVWNGKWTIDKAMELTDKLYEDLNGDGNKDTNDSFGIVGFSFPYRWAESFGIEAYKKTPNSPELALDINNERVHTIVDKLHTWFFSGNNSAWIDFNAAKDDGRNIFSAGRSLMLLDTVGWYTPIVVETEVDFGIIPYPKLDENQEDYYVGSGDGLFCVPITAPDTERTGIIIEAMTYQGYKRINDAYIETTLKQRYASDEECSKMLEFIFERQVLSFSYLYANSVPDGMQYKIIYDTVPTNNFSSWYARSEKKELKFMESLSEAFK